MAQAAKFERCGGSSTFIPKRVTLDPPVAVAGKKLKVKIDGNLKDGAQVTRTAVGESRLWLHGLELDLGKNGNFNVCADIEGLECPVFGPTEMELLVEEKVPNMAVGCPRFAPDCYKLRVRAVDEDGSLITCLDIPFTVTEK